MFGIFGPEELMMLQIALVFLCLAQIVQYSRHWLVLTAGLYEEFTHSRLKSAIDWNPGANSRRRRGKRFAR